MAVNSQLMELLGSYDSLRHEIAANHIAEERAINPTAAALIDAMVCLLLINRRRRGEQLWCPLHWPWRCRPSTGGWLPTLPSPFLWPPLPQDHRGLCPAADLRREVCSGQAKLGPVADGAASGPAGRQPLLLLGGGEEGDTAQ